MQPALGSDLRGSRATEEQAPGEMQDAQKINRGKHMENTLRMEKASQSQSRAHPCARERGGGQGVQWAGDKKSVSQSPREAAVSAQGPQPWE